MVGVRVKETKGHKELELLSHPLLVKLNQLFRQVSHCLPVTPSRQVHSPPNAEQSDALSAPTGLQSHSESSQRVGKTVKDIQL